MNWEQVKNDWREARGQARAEWGELTVDDLDKVEGDRAKLVERLQERYGIDKGEAEHRVERWLQNRQDWAGQGQ